MHPPLCGSGWHLCILGSPRGRPYSPKRCWQDWRDLGASADMWEWLDAMHTPFSHGASLFPKKSR